MKNMKKTISFRLFCTVVGRAVGQVFRFLGRFFGYRDDLPLFKVLWRICSVCMTMLLVLFTGCVLYGFITDVVLEKWFPDVEKEEETWTTDQHLSNHIVYQRKYWTDETRVYNEQTGEVLLEDIEWIVVAENQDSLAVFARNGKRGYLNRFTGRIQIPAVYSKAWIFSEGLAGVEKDGKLFFIDPAGNTVIGGDFYTQYGFSAYVFHNGYCRIMDPCSRLTGLIDRDGNWALEPEYRTIDRADSLWIVQKEGEEAVLDCCLDTVLPFAPVDYQVMNGAVYAVRQDHSKCKYSLQGELLDDFYILNVSRMTYPGDRLFYGTIKTYNDEGNVVDETTESEPRFEDLPARCRRYQADYGWYGLMTPEGQVVTPPSYSDITAVGEDLYLCEEVSGYAILLNGKGEKVQ